MTARLSDAYIGFFAAVGSIVLVSCGDQSAPEADKGAQLAKPEVAVITLRPQQVPLRAVVPGRLAASAVSEIRPQVSGLIERRLFEEGTEVQAGDILYEIDDRPYRAALASAEAGIQRAQAAVAAAEAEFNRTAQLRKGNVASQQAVDTARATLLQAQADLAASNASVQSAQIDLDNTRVASPISGLIATSLVTQGALVTANQVSPLTTVRQIDPMYVDLTASSAALIRVRRMLREGTVSQDPSGTAIHLTLEDGTAYSEVGKIEALEGSVSETTGSVTVRGSISNPQRVLLPGMYVRARVEIGTEKAAFLVPQRAVNRNARGQATAMFVSADGRAEPRQLDVEQSEGAAWLVREGIVPGERLIVEGFQTIREGQEVQAVEAEIDAQGLVQ